MPLITEPHYFEATSASAYPAGDNFYEALIAAHQGLSDEQSSALNARLVLLLSNHIGDLEVLREALQVARKNL